jgi:peptidoglycan-associated lipoprotein
MPKALTKTRSVALIALVGAALLLTACAKKPTAGMTGATAGVTMGGAGGPPGSSQDFVVNVGDRVFFDTDSTELTVIARGTLDRQAQWLNRYPRTSFIIEGHADERGTREYNIALGARRAAAVHDYLVAMGVSGHRIRTISYGKERPVAVCNDISCWSQNRRAVTVINSAGM